MAARMTREQKREIHAKGTPEAKALLQALANVEFAEAKLRQERDEFGTIGPALSTFEAHAAKMAEEYQVALTTYQGS